MAIKKGNAPKTIPAKLTIKGQGETSVLNVTYHNRKSSEIEAHIKELRESEAAFLPALIVFLVAEWDTDFSLSIEGSGELEDERPGMLQNIVEGYHRARRSELEKKLKEAVKALSWKRPTAEELKGTGLRPSHYTEPMAEVWAESWPAIELYLSGNTQWIQGAAGPTGLNYVWFDSQLDRKNIHGEEREELMTNLRTIEGAYLERFYAKTPGKK